MLQHSTLKMKGDPGKYGTLTRASQTTWWEDRKGRKILLSRNESHWAYFVDTDIHRGRGREVHYYVPHLQNTIKIWVWISQMVEQDMQMWLIGSVASLNKKGSWWKTGRMDVPPRYGKSGLYTSTYPCSKLGWEKIMWVSY